MNLLELPSLSAMIKLVEFVLLSLRDTAWCFLASMCWADASDDTATLERRSEKPVERRIV